MPAITTSMVSPYNCEAAAISMYPPYAQGRAMMEVVLKEEYNDGGDPWIRIGSFPNPFDMCV